MPTTISQPDHQTAITGIVSTEDAHVRRLFVGASAIGSYLGRHNNDCAATGYPSAPRPFHQTT
jgi:hypothetical protein